MLEIFRACFPTKPTGIESEVKAHDKAASLFISTLSGQQLDAMPAEVLKRVKVVQLMLEVYSRDAVPAISPQMTAALEDVSTAAKGDARKGSRDILSVFALSRYGKAVTRHMAGLCKTDAKDIVKHKQFQDGLSSMATLCQEPAPPVERLPAMKIHLGQMADAVEHLTGRNWEKEFADVEAHIFF